MREGKSPWDVLDTSALIVGSRVNAGLDGFDSNKVSQRIYHEDRELNVCSMRDSCGRTSDNHVPSAYCAFASRTRRHNKENVW